MRSFSLAFLVKCNLLIEWSINFNEQKEGLFKIDTSTPKALNSS